MGLKDHAKHLEMRFRKWQSQDIESLLIIGEDQTNIVDHQILLDLLHCFWNFLMQC